MEFDIFFSICQTDVHGYMPSEKVMFENFFEQVELADRLGFGTAWVAESHLSTEVQKTNPGAVIPHFVGEIGLNTDILQLAHRIFARTKRIGVGSAIMNILCNGGPIAAAERIKTFLTLHGLDENESRILTVGFAAGRVSVHQRPVRNRAAESGGGGGVAGREEQDLRRGDGDFSPAAERRDAELGHGPRAPLKRADFRSDADWQRVSR